MILDLPGADLIGWVSELVGADDSNLRPPVAFDFVRDRREVRLGGDTITLTRLEAEVLAALIDRAPGVVGREELIESVWRRAFVGSNVVDTVIRSHPHGPEARGTSPPRPRTRRRGISIA